MKLTKANLLDAGFNETDAEIALRLQSEKKTQSLLDQLTIHRKQFIQQMRKNERTLEILDYLLFCLREEN